MSAKVNLEELRVLDLDFDWENAFNRIGSFSLLNVSIVPVSNGDGHFFIDGHKNNIPKHTGYSVAYRDWQNPNCFLFDDKQIFTSEMNAKEWFDRNISILGVESLTTDKAIYIANEYLDCCNYLNKIVKDLEKSLIRGRCKKCIFYNVLTDEDGACQNPDFHKHVTTASKEFLLGVLKVSDSAAEVIVGSLRVNDNFGCIHFQKDIR